MIRSLVVILSTLIGIATSVAQYSGDPIALQYRAFDATTIVEIKTELLLQKYRASAPSQPDYRRPLVGNATVTVGKSLVVKNVSGYQVPSFEFHHKSGMSAWQSVGFIGLAVGKAIAFPTSSDYYLDE